MTTSGVYAQTVGSSGHRVFIAQWNVPPYNGSGDATFQLQISETDGVLRFLYADTATAVSVSLGSGSRFLRLQATLTP